MGAVEGRGRGSRAIAWPDTVDALLPARFFCTVRSLALPRGFPGMFFPSLQVQVYPILPQSQPELQVPLGQKVSLWLQSSEGF